MNTRVPPVTDANRLTTLRTRDTALMSIDTNNRQIDVQVEPLQVSAIETYLDADTARGQARRPSADTYPMGSS